MLIPRQIPRMSVRKRNEFLEGSDDEDVGDGYGSDDEEGRGGIGGSVSKRRKVENVDESDDDSFHSFADDETHQEVTKSLATDAPAQQADRFELGSDFADEDAAPLTAPAPPKPRPKAVAAAEKAARRSGVVYISRVPPFMKPSVLRHFLLPHAPSGLGRIFLTPEAHTSHLARVKRGGNKKKSFTDGWVEFTVKREAKFAAEGLNGEIMGGKKGGFYRDDLWNVKYLRGFKWANLTEQIANENAERNARMREELRRTKRENRAFAEDVERGKMVEGMERKREAKRVAKRGDGADEEDLGPVKSRRPGMEFKQKKARERSDLKDESGKVDQRRVLSMIL
ncbi:RNA-binding ATPase activator esf2 [Teratosphaeriaceae sp. CCFEE 6253]|nr:RNA-binding ATPase activator esf2 [Teratosphaeriaceae sp. CCFEE 6253]